MDAFERQARRRPRSLLAATTLHLATPTTLARGLALVGLEWSVSDAPAGAGRGMYAWVARSGQAPPVESGVLYLGVAQGKGGLKGRTDYEQAFDRGDHSHGLAIARNDARVVSGPVDEGRRDLGWVTPLVAAKELDPSAGPIIEDWCQSWTLSAVEEVAIRLAIHLGDTGAPVNSQHAGAWKNERPGDWVAYAIAQQLSSDARDACKQQTSNQEEPSNLVR